MMRDTDMDDQTAVLDTLALIRLLDGNVRAEVEHHDSKYKKDLRDRYPANVASSGSDEIVRVVQDLMAVEGSKWCDQVTAQPKNAKTNVGSRVEKTFCFENSLQLEFQPAMRLETAFFYPIRQARGPPIY